MLSKKELLYFGLLMAFVWLALFVPWPLVLKNFLFLTVVILNLGVVTVGWWSWIKTQDKVSVPRWRTNVGFFGLVANTAALAVPIFGLLYLIVAPFLQFRMRLPNVDGQYIVLGVVLFSVSGLIAGIFAPPRTRFLTLAAALVIVSLIVSIPMGVL